MTRPHVEFADSVVLGIPLGKRPKRSDSGVYRVCAAEPTPKAARKVLGVELPATSVVPPLVDPRR